MDEIKPDQRGQALNFLIYSSGDGEPIKHLALFPSLFLFPGGDL